MSVTKKQTPTAASTRRANTLRPSRHLALSTVVGGAVWAATGQPLALPITIGAGVLVDVDHGPDLWWHFALGREPTATFVLHSWELLTGLAVFGLWAGFPWWLMAVLLGYGLHISTDHVFNPGRLLSYSLVYRAYHRFKVARLAPDWDFDHAYGILRAEVPPAALLMKWWRNKSRVRRSVSE